MKVLHAFLCFLLFGSGLLVSSAINPVESVLFLILTFCNAAAILFIFNAEFLGLIFVIIYVGAIAVLFLFVIMMLDLKTKSVEKINIKFLPTGFYMALFFLLSSLINNFQYWFKMRNPYYNSIKYNEYYNWFNKTEVILEIEAIGQVLYNYYVLSFLISGFLLFLAVLGSISLTTNFKTQQNLFESVKQV
jgi:NADH-quinone oxidoreductase subunit J